MGEHVLPGNPPVAVTLRRSARARRISLRVSGVDGRVTLTLPHGVSEETALNFAQEKSAWLRRQMSKQPTQIHVAHGAALPIEGHMIQIAPGSGRRIVVDGDVMQVPGHPHQVASRVQAWLKTHARHRLAEASDQYAAQIGRRFSRLTLRDTRSRWGSCTSEGGLMYSWRLILAPPEVLRYVAAHEVAHLVEMNHSPAFWSIVDRLYPSYDTPRRWLRENGSALHRYQFA